MPDEQQPETPDQIALRVAASKPLGWDQVRPNDDCDCERGGDHQVGCDYYGWEA